MHEGGVSPLPEKGEDTAQPATTPQGQFFPPPPARESTTKARHSQQPLAANSLRYSPHLSPFAALERRREHVTHVFRVLQCAPRTERYAGKRVIGDGNRQPGLIAQYLIEIGQKRPTAREDDTLVHD